jgi:hypothetical protein
VKSIKSIIVTLIFEGRFMEYPSSVITRTRSGKVEVRGFTSRGRYVIYQYLNPETGKADDKKKKLCLMDEEGKIQEFFIIPLKSSNRSLLVVAEKGDAERKVWNPKTGSEETLWK